MAAVMDANFLTGLRAVAEQFSDALADRASLARDADSYQAAEVADIAAGAFLALAELASKRLVAAVEEEQDGPGEIAARRALTQFDTATKGGE